MITRDQAVDQAGRLRVRVPALTGIVTCYDLGKDQVVIALHGDTEGRLVVPRALVEAEVVAAGP